MTVSVVVPTYNAGKLLAEQLRALAAQDYRGPLEILVCDNGSRDGSLDAARDDQRTRVIDASARRGPAAARNIGVRAARGDLILFCDADDVAAPGWVSAMVNALKDHPVVAGRVDITRLNTHRVQVARPLAEGLQAGADSMPYAGAGNLGIERRVFLEVGGFDERLECLEDVDFSWRLQQAGHALHYEPAALVHVRLRNTFQSQFRQGYNYGRAWALLESRSFRSSGAAADLDTETPVERHEASRWATLGLMVRRVRRNPLGGLGFAVWSLGWHAGHRRAGRALTPRASGPQVGEELAEHLGE